MSSVNRYQYVPVRFSFVVAYWIRTHGVMGSNADTPVFSPLCSRYVVILQYAENYYTEVLYFTPLYGPLRVVPMSIPPYEVVVLAILVFPI
jgi:hypothetical protein